MLAIRQRSEMVAPVSGRLRRYQVEKAQLVDNTATGLCAVIEMHSTTRGPATGDYIPCEDEGTTLHDVRLLERPPPAHYGGRS